MRRPIALLLLVLLATGCGTSRLKRANHLLDDVRGYHDGIRWGKLAQAVVRLPAAQRDAFVQEREMLADDLRIADIELVRVRYVKGKMRAKVRVQYTWHLDSRGIVHKTWADEIWERRGKRWILRDETRAHGEPMPGLSDPPEGGRKPRRVKTMIDPPEKPEKPAVGPVAAGQNRK